jgi:hypothetical protein
MTTYPSHITTGRILWGVQYQLASNSFRCVANWFTDSADAIAYRRELETCGCYKDITLVHITLPDIACNAKLIKHVD